MFYLRLKELRKEKGISQEELAFKIGISTSIISKYEKNERQPTLPIAFKIAHYFNVSVDYLSGKTTEKYTHMEEEIKNILIQLSNDKKKELLRYAKYLLEA